MDREPIEGESPEEFVKRIKLEPSSAIQYLMTQAIHGYGECLLEEGYQEEDINDGIHKAVLQLVCVAAAKSKDYKKFLSKFIKEISQNYGPINKQLNENGFEE